MKRLLFIPFILITLTASATNYYIKNGGDDQAAGTSDEAAWATISKVNSFWAAGTFAPGDSILFKRGDSWYGTIVVAEPGTSGNPIVIGAYGIGAKPILTGFTTISTWSVYSGSVYEASIPNSEDQTNMVVIDGQPVAMGRYPDTGWRSYTTATTTTIYDASLPDSPDWTGAEVVINKEYWITDRCNITDQASGIITFSGGKYSGTSPNRRYFIQNDLRCVTAATEWYHDESAGKLYMYGNQEGKDVKMATLNRLIYNNGHDHIHIRDLKLTGSISHAIHLNSSAHYNRIQDCDISYAGGSAIEDYGGNFLEAHYNNIIHSNYGIYCTGSDSRITNNDIAYIGMINGSAFMPHATGIYISSTNITVEYNTIQYTEWSGINTSSASTYSIYRNFINYPCMLIDDGGGIYSTSSQGTRTISQNIVLNSGVGSEDWLIIPRGIYYDAGGSGASITNNIVAGCKGAGLLIHYGDNHTITGNLLYNNQRQAEFLKYGTGVSTGITFNNNRLIARTSSQLSLRSASYTEDEIKAWGTFDYNYYARPIKDDNHFYYTSAYHTLAEWKMLVSPDDANSLGSPVSLSSDNDLHFIYNNTLAVKSYFLSTTMRDITGTSYSGTIQLQQFTGTVLLGTGTVTEITQSPNVFYVSQSGLDDASRNGSVGQEWATLSYACSRVTRAGDTIRVTAGNYNETAQCNLSAGVSIKGAGRTTTKITAASSLTRLIYASSTAGTNGNQLISDITFDFNMNALFGVQFFGRSNVIIERTGFENSLRYGLTIADVLGRSENTEPVNWAENNIIRYCHFVNCGRDSFASYTWEADGAIDISGQENMLIYGNDIDNKTGGRYAYGIKGLFYGGFFKGLKIYDNKIRTNIRDVAGEQSFGFNVELWTGVGGNEVYHNDCNGCIDIGGRGWWDSCGYGYAIKVYENVLIRDTRPTNQPEAGLILESGGKDGCYFYRNWVENFTTGFTLGTTANSIVQGYDGVWVTYNIFCNIGYATGGVGAGIGGYNLSSGVTIKNYNVLNNVIHKVNNSSGWGISYEYATANNWENVNLKNNIVFNAYTPIQFRNQTVTSMYIHNNLTYGATRTISHSDSWANSTITLREILNNLENTNPLFNSVGTDFSLQSNSPCINVGTYVGLTRDFYNRKLVGVPDIGAIEYGATGGERFGKNRQGVMLKSRDWRMMIYN